MKYKDYKNVYGDEKNHKVKKWNTKLKKNILSAIDTGNIYP